MNKVCFLCKIEKDINCFYTRPGARDGHRGECRECTLAKEKQYRKDNPELWRQIARRSYQKHREEYCLASNKRKNKIRIEVLTYYGDGKCACVYCGFNDVRALSLDHIAGGGKKHSREIGRTNLAQWLMTRSYPEGYQTLCMNCQFIKKVENKEQNKR